MIRGLPIVAAVCLLLVTACSNVRFERGPYAIRELEVVYSEQEDLTFFLWKLRGDAQLSLVEFEIWQDDGYLPVDLAAAPFAADPYKCGEFRCFQYQLPGEYVLPAQDSPMRSVHRDEGLFMGPNQRSRRVQSTFGVDPIALGKNDSIDPRRFDWFKDNELPLRRGYDWQFADLDGARCAEPVGAAWKKVDEPISVDPSWTARAAERGICFHLRPRRSDLPAGWVTAVLLPSAETEWETLHYVPARVDAPVVWGLLIDLEIPDETRCRQVKGALIDMVEAAMASRGDDLKLGIYTPVDSTDGNELTGCDQAPARDYPLEQMLRDAQTVKSELEPEKTRVLWIFANNIELPPSQRILDQLQIFGLALLYGEATDGGGIDAIPDDIGLPIPDGGEDLIELGTSSFTWAIGSNVFMGLFPWNITTPWRPVEDATLVADVKAVAQSTLPFATMRHESDTRVEITLPPDVDVRPQAFKVCDATPFPVSSVGVGESAWTGLDAVAWPQFDDFAPYYRVEIPPQILVPNSEFIRRNEQVVVEFCTAFCNGPFRSRGGDDYPEWWFGGGCQWNL